jgi:hypothetical protein
MNMDIFKNVEWYFSDVLFFCEKYEKKETIAKYSGSIFYYEQFTKATVIVI